jgi:hypothetical protein
LVLAAAAALVAVSSACSDDAATPVVTVDAGSDGDTQVADGDNDAAVEDTAPRWTQTSTTLARVTQTTSPSTPNVVAGGSGRRRPDRRGSP